MEGLRGILQCLVEQLLIRSVPAFVPCNYTSAHACNRPDNGSRGLCTNAMHLPAVLHTAWRQLDKAAPG